MTSKLAVCCGAGIFCSLLVGSPTAQGQEVDGSTRFASEVKASRVAYQTALETADDDHRLRVERLRAAGAALTEEARRRLADGPIAEARRARDALLEAAAVEFARRLMEAAGDYGPASTVSGAVKAATEALRTEFEVYRDVVDVADEAAADAAFGFESAAAVDAARGSDAESLEMAARRAKATYDEAERAYETAVANEPRPIEPRKTGGENVGRFLEAVNSLAQGNRAAAERSAREMGRAREAALSDAETANRAARAAYDSTVALALEARDDAYSAYRASAASAQRVRRGANEALSDRESTAADYKAARSASRTAFVELLRVTRVYQAVELREVERALMAGALSAVAELSEEALGRITGPAARQAMESALAGSFAEPRRAALEHLDALELELTNSNEELALRSAALEAAKRESAASAREASSAFESAQKSYSRALEAADDSLVDHLVRAATGFKGMKKRRDIIGAASEDHMRAQAAARQARAAAWAQALPGLAVSAPNHPVFSSYVDGVDGHSQAAALERYKTARSVADQQYRSRVVASWTRDATTLETTRERQYRRALAARDAAREALDEGPDTVRDALDPPFGSTANAGPFRAEARERYRVLEADVRAGLLALTVGVGNTNFRSQARSTVQE